MIEGITKWLQEMIDGLVDDIVSSYQYIIGYFSHNALGLLLLLAFGIILYITLED